MAASLVLLIEDDPAVRDTLAEILTREGFGVQTADSEAASLQLLAGQAYDLIVTDLVVPASQSPLQRIQSLKRLVGDTPIIAITGTWRELGLTPEQLGVSDIFFKPIAIPQFLARLHTILR
jgi:two-component system OmpR family response regulator